MQVNVPSSNVISKTEPSLSFELRKSKVTPDSTIPCHVTEPDRIDPASRCETATEHSGGAAHFLFRVNLPTPALAQIHYIHSQAVAQRGFRAAFRFLEAIYGDLRRLDKLRSSR